LGLPIYLLAQGCQLCLPLRAFGSQLVHQICYNRNVAVKVLKFLSQHRRRVSVVPI
jgi:hypothetical protein